MTGLRVGFAVDNGIRAFCLCRSVAKEGFLLGADREVSRSADAISPPERSFFVVFAFFAEGGRGGLTGLEVMA